MKKIIIAFFIFTILIILSLPKISLAYGECTKYGSMAYASGSYCKCMTGYVMGSLMGQPYCISSDQACKDEYGYGATSDYLTDKCKCRYGYIFSHDYSGHTKCIDTGQYCRDKIGLSSSYNSLTDSCECSYGYVLIDTTYGQECISGNQACRKKYGVMSEYDKVTKKCTCSSGYVFTKNLFGDLDCESCSNVHGIHSSYNYLTEDCECDDGYTIDDKSQCIKKQNNVYFKLIELDINSSKALIKSEYDNKYYLVEYRSGCYRSSFNGYLSKQIVVNLGTDSSVDKGDKIILQNDKETCEISSTERVDSDFSFFKDKKDNIIFNIPITTNKQPTMDIVLTNKLKGKILLQIESHGEAWYVNPEDGERYYMADGDKAYQVMRNLGVGITNNDLEKIQSNKATAKKYSGKIFLQVQSHGEAYYIDFNGVSHYLKDGAAAYEVMRSLGLGITIENLNKISEGSL